MGHGPRRTDEHFEEKHEILVSTDAGVRVRLEGIIEAAEESGHVLAGERGGRKSPADGPGGASRTEAKVTREHDGPRPQAPAARLHDHDVHPLLH